MTTQDEKIQAEIDALDKQLGETKPGSVEETIITQKLLALLKSRPAPIASREGETQIVDLDKIDWEAIQEAALKSNWIPPQYFRNDWVSDVCSFLRGGETDQKLLSAMVVLFNHINGDAKHREAIKAWHTVKDRLGQLPPHPRKLRADDGWLPIESAPKDGTVFLCAKKNGHIEPGAFIETRQRFEYWRSPSAIFCATHWQPLPPAPEGKS